MIVYQPVPAMRREIADSRDPSPTVLRAPARRSAPYILMVDRDARVVYADQRTGWHKIVEQFGPMRDRMLPGSLSAFVRSYARNPDDEEPRAVLEGTDVVAWFLPLAGERQPLLALALAQLEVDGTLAAAAARYALTRREEQILHAVLSGAPSQEIARRFSIRLATVEWHTKRLLMKTASANRTEMVARVLGWIGDDA